MTPEAAILGIGGYIPRTRIARSTIAEVWGAPAAPGERALAAPDEDAVTMAVEAGLTCLGTADRSQVDAVYFASTTAPYAEKQGAAIVAAALDLREDVATADFADTLRAGTAALRAARDAVASGSARQVLVVAADRRVPEPESPLEQIFGDGAAAALVGPPGPGALARIGVSSSVAEEVTAGWRRQGDPYVRSYSPKHEVDFGFARPVADAVGRVLHAAGLEPGDVAVLALPSPDARAHLKAAGLAGIDPGRVQDPLAFQVGVLGTPAPLVALAAALERTRPGDRVVVAAHGEGADAILLEVVGELPPGAWRPSAAAAERRPVSSYGAYVRANKLMDVPVPDIPSSPVGFWRDRRMSLNLRGMRCEACGLVQYPVGRVCQRCKARDRGVEVPLARRGTVFTYTLDHIVAATYSTVPVARAIVDLEGGGRILTQVVDCEAEQMRVGMPVRLVFRCMHEGGGFKNYYWKAVPA